MIYMHSKGGELLTQFKDSKDNLAEKLPLESCTDQDSTLKFLPFLNLLFLSLAGQFRSACPAYVKS